MPIFPESSKRMIFHWEIAALNLPIPENLLDRTDQKEWNSYATALPPGRLLETLGQALDQFHSALQNNDLESAPIAEKIKIHAKWQAAAILGYRIQERLQFGVENDSQRFRSDLSRALFYVTDFLQTTNSAQLPIWQKRVQAHLAVDNRDPPFYTFLNEMAAYEREQKVKSPGPNPSL